MGSRDEVPEHLLRDLEVGDDSVTKRADGADVPRCASEHLFGFAPDREHDVDPARVFLDRDDGWLTRNDALALHVDERVCGAEIDRKIVREQAVKPVEDHLSLLTADGSDHTLERP